MIREYLDSRQAKQCGQWRAEQEYVWGYVMSVETEIVLRQRIVEQRVGGSEQVREPAAIFEIGVTREVREDPSGVCRKQQREHDEDDTHVH